MTDALGDLLVAHDDGSTPQGASVGSSSTGPRPRSPSSPPRERPTKQRKEGAGAKPRRASRACDQCRRQKLRCQLPPGETNCTRCQSHHMACEFERPAPIDARRLAAITGLNMDVTEKLRRLDQLESNMERVVRFLETDRTSPSVPSSAPSHQPIPSVSAISLPPPTPPLSIAGPASLNSLVEASVNSLNGLPKTTPINGGPGSSSSPQGGGSIPSPSMSVQGRSTGVSTSASRLRVFEDQSADEAPFRAIVYNPDNFVNSSRFASPAPDEGAASAPSPVHDILEEELARDLFQSFVRKILLYMPILVESVTFDGIKTRSPFLLSTMLAIAARYCVAGRGSETFNPRKHDAIVVTQDQYSSLRSLAMQHMCVSLMSKVHVLEDVQALCFLAGWGLSPKGQAPDSWMLTGFAYRLAQRLGLQDAGRVVAATPVPTARQYARWLTYLTLFSFDRYLTVGFGRPGTEGFHSETLGVQPLITMLTPGAVGPISPSTAASVASRVELSIIARQYSEFVASLHHKLINPLVELDRLNDALDEFNARWMWSSSNFAAHLGPWRRPLRLMYDHLRLCLNAIPLRTGNEDLFGSRTSDLTGDGGAFSTFISRCQKRTKEASTSIIQANYDSLREDDDGLLTYSFDYSVLILAHSALVLLRLSAVAPSPIITSESMNHYFGMALDSLTQGDRSVSQFATDLGRNLRTILDEWNQVQKAMVAATDPLPDSLEHDDFPFPTPDAHMHFSGDSMAPPMQDDSFAEFFSGYTDLFEDFIGSDNMAFL
ncbi:hypothetical protein T439DRAFT_323951 [Meredithblackwellia eburnea MCA 4105]